MARRKKRRSRSCVCGSGKPYPVCCRKFHEQKAEPEDPETLMRSRYSAYALEKVRYIIHSTDPEGEAWLGEEGTKEGWRDSVAAFCEATDFNGLEIREVDVDGDEATVTFHAELDRGGFDASFTETSRFVRRDGRWMYNEALESTDELEEDSEEADTEIEADDAEPEAAADASASE